LDAGIEASIHHVVGCLQRGHAFLQTDFSGVPRVVEPNLCAGQIEPNVHQALNVGFVAFKHSFDATLSNRIRQVRMLDVDGKVLERGALPTGARVCDASTVCCGLFLGWVVLECVRTGLSLNGANTRQFAQDHRGIDVRVGI
jgi:hypothetical protein